MAGGFRRTRPGSDAYNKLRREGAMVAALKWAINDTNIHTTIPSMTDMDQLDENFKAMTERLTPDDKKVLAAQLEYIRPLYCRTCGHRFSERQGTLLEGAKLPEATIVRMVKCLAHGCSIEATADICEVTPRTVESLLEKAGRRAEDFHRLQLEKLEQPLEVVELDELHGRSAPAKKGTLVMLPGLPKAVADDVVRAARGFMRRWWQQHDF